MITMQNESTINASMFSFIKRFAHSCFAIAAILRCKFRLYFLYNSTSIRSFVEQYINESVPSCIAYGFSKMMILQKSCYIKLFYCYMVIFFNDLVGKFMEQIKALSAYLLMLL